MTLGEMLRFERLKAIRAPRRASIGIGGGSAAGAAAGASVPITADQGPLPDGSNLGQASMPNMQSGIVPGRNRMSIGNSARGNIDLGSFLSARPNQDALNQLAQNPLAQVDPYKATTGVGGFFRRLLGDDANERNEMAAAQRGQTLAQKWLVDQQAQSRMGVLDKYHQYEMERLKAAADKDAENIKYRTQLDLQAKQLENQWAVDNAGKLAKQQATSEFDRLTGIVGDPIVASQLQEQILRAPIAKLMADAAESNARAQGTGGFAPRPVQGRPAPIGFESLTGNLIQEKATGLLFNYDPETGMRTPVGLGGASQGGIDPSVLGAVKTEAAELDRQSQIAKYQQPPSVIGGAAEVLGDIPGMYNQAVMGHYKDVYNSPLVQQTAIPINFLRTQALDPAAEALKRYQLNKNRQRLQQLGTNAPTIKLP